MELKNNISIYTVCNVAYLNKVMILSESIYNYNKIKLDIFVFDKKRKLTFNQDKCNIHWIEDLEIPFFNTLSFKYTIIELSTSLKAYLALKLLKYNSKVIFFDPDVEVFNSLDVIFNQLDHHPVILTPHYFYPKSNGEIDDAKIMRFGTYNLGFFAVNSSLEAVNFLSWWSDRCITNAYDDAQFGIFTDQKWVSIAQCFFPFIHVSYNPGLNVAYWNLNERSISINTNGTYVINNDHPLLFFHFSSFDNNLPVKLSKIDFEIGGNSKTIIYEFALKYSEKLIEFSYISEDTKYSYDYMSDGQYISPSLRRAYASVFNEFPKNHDPFDSIGVISDFAKKNHLFQKNNLKYSVQGYKNTENHKKKIKIVFCTMRVILRIVGPNNFMNISKLLVYLSSYQRNRDMWKR